MKRTVRIALGALDLDIVRKSSIRRTEALLNLLNDFETLVRYRYGYFQRGGPRSGTFWSTHEAGFFSCLTTILWSIIDIQRSGWTCYAIDNSLGMNKFKELSWRSTYYDVFEQKAAHDIDHLMDQSPIQPFRFNQHGCFQGIVDNCLGREWIRKYLSAYMAPSQQVLSIANGFDEKYRISSVPTIAVCYRGTDKHKEVAPSPLSVYYHAIDELRNGLPEAEVLVQTDQKQVRDAFLSRYGNSCKYIEELPVTSGATVIHKNAHLCGNRAIFAQRLYAMCLAVSRSEVLVTHTGNVGLFLALHAFVAGRKVVQFQ